MAALFGPVQGLDNQPRNFRRMIHDGLGDDFSNKIIWPACISLLAMDAIMHGVCYAKDDWIAFLGFNLVIYGGLACYEGVACLKNRGAGSSLPRMPSMINKFVLAMVSKAAISTVAFHIIFSSGK